MSGYGVMGGSLGGWGLLLERGGSPFTWDDRWKRRGQRDLHRLSERFYISNADVGWVGRGVGVMTESDVFRNGLFPYLFPPLLDG